MSYPGTTRRGRRHGARAGGVAGREAWYRRSGPSTPSAAASLALARQRPRLGRLRQASIQHTLQASL